MVDVVIQTMGRGTVHHAVFAEKTCGAVLVDDEMERLIVPAIGAIAMPVSACSLFQRYGGGIVQADDKRGALDGLECGLVGGIGGDEPFPRRGPEVPVG